jgi:hypothetical protein
MQGLVTPHSAVRKRLVTGSNTGVPVEMIGGRLRGQPIPNTYARVYPCSRASVPAHDRQNPLGRDSVRAVSHDQ